MCLFNLAAVAYESERIVLSMVQRTFRGHTCPSKSEVI